MSEDLQQPLSEAEIERLAARLEANENAGALSLEAVDGLFCALSAAPGHRMPSDYLPVILGAEAGEGGVFRDAGDAGDTLMLLMRYWNSILQDFERDGIHLAYLIEPGVDGISGRTWARGYMQGTRLSPQGWKVIFTDEQEGLLLTIPVAAGEVDPQWPPEPLTEERREELLSQMLAAAGRAYQYFRTARESSAGGAAADAGVAIRRPAQRVAPKVGRNDPCPCGSGRKYKKCCGGAGDALF